MKYRNPRICSRTTCNNPEAVWWNTVTLQYYCTSCARLINESADGGGICKLDTTEMEEVKEFEMDRFYRHGGGNCIHIIGKVETTLYGQCFVAEEHDSPHLMPIGMGTGGYSQNWYLTDQDDWMTGYS